MRLYCSSTELRPRQATYCQLLFQVFLLLIQTKRLSYNNMLAGIVISYLKLCFLKIKDFYLDWNEPGFSPPELFEVDRVDDRGPQQLQRKRPIRKAELGLNKASKKRDINNLFPVFVIW